MRKIILIVVGLSAALGMFMSGCRPTGARGPSGGAGGESWGETEETAPATPRPVMMAEDGLAKPRSILDVRPDVDPVQDPSEAATSGQASRVAKVRPVIESETSEFTPVQPEIDDFGQSAEPEMANIDLNQEMVVIDDTPLPITPEPVVASAGRPAPASREDDLAAVESRLIDQLRLSSNEFGGADHELSMIEPELDERPNRSNLQSPGLSAPETPFVPVAPEGPEVLDTAPILADSGETKSFWSRKTEGMSDMSAPDADVRAMGPIGDETAAPPPPPPASVDENADRAVSADEFSVPDLPVDDAASAAVDESFESVAASDETEPVAVEPVPITPVPDSPSDDIVSNGDEIALADMESLLEIEENAFDSNEMEADQADAIAQNGAEMPSEEDLGMETQPVGEETELTGKAAEIAVRERIIAEGRQMEAKAKFFAGMNLYQNHLYNEALAAFEEALKFDPEHKEARTYRDKVRELLGEPGPDKEDRLIKEIADREHVKLVGVEMRLMADLEEAEQLYVRATTPDETRQLLPLMEQIAEAMGDLDKAMEKLRQVDSVLGTSPITSTAQKNIRLRAQALRTQIEEKRASLLTERERIERERAKTDAEQHAREAKENHNKRIARLLQSAEYWFNRREYEKARQMANEILKMDPHNQQAIQLRGRARSEAHRKAKSENERRLYDAEVNWTLDVRKNAIMPSEDLLYPDDWEQIKMRAQRKREMDAGTEVEREIRDKLESVRISVEYVQQPLRDVLREIQDRGRVNVVADAAVDKDMAVTLTVSDMTLGKVLEWIMELTELHYEIKDEAIFISEEPQANVILQIYPVYDLTRPMRDYFPPDDEDFEDDDDDDDVEETVYLDITERIPEVIQGNWDDPGVSIDVWEDNLIVMQTPQVHAQILQYINRLREFAKQQVLVEGRFLDVTDDLLEEIGISWYDPNQMPPTDTVPNSPWGVRNYHADDGRWMNTGFSIRPGQGAAGGATSNFGLNLNYGYLSTEPLRQFETDAVLHALKEKRRGTVLHAPRLLVANGKNAYLQIRTLTNYISTYTQQGDIFQPEVTEYEQGVQWSVRPVISYDRKYITIRVRPRLTAFDAANSRTETMYRVTVVGGTEGSRQGDLVELPFFLPVLKLTQLESYVTVPDGGTILIGGLIQDNRDEAISGIPLISSIPFLGRFTRSENRDYSKQNLVIMVQGHIIELDG